MSLQLVLVSAFIACCFAGWPILASKAQANGAWIGTLVAIGSIVPSLLFGVSRKEFGESVVGRDVLLLIAAGIFNGVGFYFYSKKVGDATVPTAQFVVTISVLMVGAAALIGWLLKGEAPTARQWLGYGVAAVAIWLLSK